MCWIIQGLIVLNCVKHPFQQYFCYITVASAPINAFLEIFYLILCTIFFPSHWLLFHITYCRNNGQRSVSKTYHQSFERILAKLGIEPATSCSQVRNATDWAMGLGSCKFEQLSTWKQLHEEWSNFKIGAVPNFLTVFQMILDFHAPVNEGFCNHCWKRGKADN